LAQTIQRRIAVAYFGKYETPDDLMHDDSLSHDEKVRMLEQWRDDKKDYMRATDEGMEGEDRAELLKKIKKALAALQ
jgi:hypothetical protein